MRKILFIGLLILSGLLSCSLVSGCHPQEEVSEEYTEKYEVACDLFYHQGRHDSSLVLCQYIVQNGLYGSDREKHLDVLVLESKIFYGSMDIPQLLEVSNEGILLAHELGREDLESFFLGQVGYALWHTGRKEPGLLNLEMSINLLKKEKTFSALKMYVEEAKRLVWILCQEEQLEKAMSLVTDVMTRVGDFASAPHEYTNEFKHRLQPQLSAFLDTAKGQVHAMRAYVNLKMNRLEEARKDAAMVEDTEWSKSADASYMMSFVWSGLKEYRKFESALPLAHQFLGSDTLSESALLLVEIEAETAASQGDYAKAYHLMLHVVEEANQLYAKIDAEQIAVQAVRYQNLEKRMQKTHAEAAILNYIAGICICLALITIVGGCTIYYVRRKHYMEAMGNFVQLENEEDEGDDESPADVPVVAKKVQNELYERILKLMNEKEPYCNPDFDRKVLAEMLMSNTSYVSQAINAQGKNFSTWLAEFRVRKAIRLLRQDPNMQTKELCQAVGVLNQVVFVRQFKNVTGNSIVDFKEELKRLQ